MKDSECCPQGSPKCSFFINCMHTHAHDHTPPLEQHKHTQQCTRGESTVRMVPSPGDPGRGSQEVARCKLGERWVQRLSAHSLSALSLTPPPTTAAPPLVPHPHPTGYRWPKRGRRAAFGHSGRLLFPPALYLLPVFFSKRSGACERQERKV